MASVRVRWPWPTSSTGPSIARTRADHALGPRSRLGDRLAAGAAVAPQVPVRSRATDLGRRAALVLAVVDLHQVLVELQRVAEPGQLRRAPRALQRAREHQGERAAAQPLAERRRLLLAMRGQRDVGASGVAPAKAPLGLAVPRQPQLVQDVIARRR